MIKRGFLLLLSLLCLHTAFAYTERNLLQSKADSLLLSEYILPTNLWVKYPRYDDRQGWDNFLGAEKAKLIADGERLLDYQWKLLKATDYLAYTRTGDRGAMQTPNSANLRALTALFFAEMAEGKGRFVDQIIDGVYMMCERSSWVLSAHLHSLQRPANPLPDSKQDIIDLGSASCGSTMAWIYFFLNKEFDKVNVQISARLKKEIENKICAPYMRNDDLWWMGFKPSSRSRVNNWNPWCNAEVLQCFLLVEQDPAKRAAGVWKTLRSTEHFINNYKEDGCCDEGPSYWGHAAGKLYDYLQVLCDATGGKLNYFEYPLLKRMGEYIYRGYVGNGWVVNFADAEAKISAGGNGLIYRYGKAIGSDNMRRFASYLKGGKLSENSIASGDIFRSLENLSSRDELAQYPTEVVMPRYTWYEDTEVCYMADKEVFVAIKGGFNNESHNHNDAGSFTYYYKQTPFFIDAGTQTYTSQTFSPQRYSIWIMQSDYHNLPKINGTSQMNGDAYRAKDVSFNPATMTFKANIADAYPAQAAITSWVRSLSLKGKKVTISDSYELKSISTPNQLNFLSWGVVDISAEGVVSVTKDDKTVLLRYDKGKFVASVEKIDLEDVRMTKIWGKELFRITLTSKDMNTRGEYKIVIEPKI